MAHSFDMLTFDFLLKPPQPFTGLFFLKKDTYIKHFNKICSANYEDKFFIV